MTPEDSTDEAGFDPSDFDVTTTRTFDAPRERVWEAWTDPDQVPQWWGPANFTVPRCEMDVRPGGAFRIDMEAPDGTVHPSDGVFDEVVEPERLVLVSGVEDDDGTQLFEVRQTVTFDDQGGETALTLEATVLEATADATSHLEGMEAGWNQSFEKLDDFLDPSGDETHDD